MDKAHVNDRSFWLVRRYMGMEAANAFKTWPGLQTMISLAGLLVLLGSRGF